jgi:hypothetical protein
LDERVGAIIAVEGSSGGSLAIRAWPVEANARFIVEQTTIALSIWREGDDVVRMSLKHDDSGSIIYLQGGPPLFEFARRLGLRLERSCS